MMRGGRRSSPKAYSIRKTSAAVGFMYTITLELSIPGDRRMIPRSVRRRAAARLPGAEMFRVGGEGAAWVASRSWRR